MADYPHRGPNLSRIRLEGVGGFIYALTPVLILLFGAPWLLLGWVALAVALVPLMRRWNRAHPRGATQLAIGFSGWLFGLLALLVIGADVRMAAFAAACMLGGVVGALLLRRRLEGLQHPSVRDHGRS